MQVTVIAGPLAGATGTLIRQDSDGCLVDLGGFYARLPAHLLESRSHAQDVSGAKSNSTESGVPISSPGSPNLPAH